MASGTLEKPAFVGEEVSTTFDDLMNYGTGIFILTTTASDPNRPYGYNVWEIIQFSFVKNGTRYCQQLAIDTSAATICYLRKYYPSSGTMTWTTWKSITFS